MRESEVAVITGASAGIGAATAEELATRGCRLVLAARRVDRLEAVAERCRALGATGVLVRPTDVADAGQVEALVAAAVAEFGRLDVMVNNAGYGLFARVHETGERQMREIFDVNYFGLFHGCRAAVEAMIPRRSGHIFNVSSVIGLRGTPFHGAYCATKFAIVGLTDALRVEMKPHNIRVTCVCPGMTDTDFFSLTPAGMHAASSYKLVTRKMPASLVARRIARAIGKNRPRIVLGAGGKLLGVMAALAPRLTDRIMKVYHDDLARRLEQDR